MSEDTDETNRENIFLKAKIIARGGSLENGDDIDPEIENRFLKNVIAFEDAPVRKMAEIIGVQPDQLPVEKDLSDSQIKEKLQELTHLFVLHNIFLDLAADLPPRIVYHFLTEEYLHEMVADLPEMQHHIDGCDGWCPECFQVDYCKIKDEIWLKDDLARERERMGNK